MPSRKATRPTDKRISANRTRSKPAPPPSRYQQLMDGTLSVEDLDDEEIMAGKCKDKGGGFRGRPPDTFPRKLHDALRLEFQKRVQERLNSSAELAMATLDDVMASRHAAAPARVRAAEIILERALGKVPDKMLAEIQVKPFEDNIEGLLVDTPDADVHNITSIGRKAS